MPTVFAFEHVRGAESVRVKLPGLFADSLRTLRGLFASLSTDVSLSLPLASSVLDDGAEALAAVKRLERLLGALSNLVEPMGDEVVDDDLSLLHPLNEHWDRIPAVRIGGDVI